MRPNASATSGTPIRECAPGLGTAHSRNCWFSSSKFNQRNDLTSIFRGVPREKSFILLPGAAQGH